MDRPARHATLVLFYHLSLNSRSRRAYIRVLADRTNTIREYLYVYARIVLRNSDHSKVGIQGVISDLNITCGSGLRVCQRLRRQALPPSSIYLAVWSHCIVQRCCYGHCFGLRPLSFMLNAILSTRSHTSTISLRACSSSRISR